MVCLSANPDCFYLVCDFYVLCIVVVAASIYSLRRLPNRYDEIRKRNGDVEG